MAARAVAFGSAAGAFALLWLTPAAADTRKPLWEFGLGVGAIAFADYRGAPTGSVYPLPVPYVAYRGRFLRADREGVRGLLFSRDVAELNVSVNATTPVRSRDSLARRGMPDLKPTIEIGPSLDLHLWRSPDRRLRLDLRLPARNALTIEASPRSVGWLFSPRINLDISGVGGRAGWNLGLLAGPLFADRRYHDYFYGVPTAFATVTRPAYAAHGGYAGSQALVSVSRRMPGYWVGAFARYDVLGGATFANSPLVRTNGYWAGGIAIAWMIGQSTTLVDVRDERL